MIVGMWIKLEHLVRPHIELVPVSVPLVEMNLTRACQRFAGEKNAILGGIVQIREFITVDRMSYSPLFVSNVTAGSSVREQQECSIPPFDRDSGLRSFFAVFAGRYPWRQRSRKSPMPLMGLFDAQIQLRPGPDLV
jgi:hypothetical protein